MTWINCYDKLPSTKDDVYECSESKLLYFKHSGEYAIGFWWPIEMAWCDSESMSSYQKEPSHWMDLPKNPKEDSTSWFIESDFEPLDDEMKIIWKDSYKEVCLGYYNDDNYQWFDGGFRSELPSHCTPTHWAMLPEAP